MKKLLKLFVLMTVAVIATVACERIDNNQIPAKELNITVVAHPDVIQSETDTDTRTYINGSNTILWGTDEYMKIGVFDGTATTWGKSSDDTKDAWNGDDEAYFTFSITPANASGSYTYYGLYPFSSAVTSSNTEPATYKVNLPTTQNATATSYDPKAYILVARPESGKTVANADWTAAFRRATALNKITLKNLSEDIKRVTITAPTGVYLAGARHIDLTTGDSGDIYSGGGRTETVDVKYATKLSGGADMDIWFTSWEASIPVDAHLVIVAYSDTHTYTRDITVVNNPITFLEGYLNTLSVNMSSAIQGDNTELAEGNYVVLAKDGTDYYALKAEKEAGKERLLSVEYTGALDSYLGDADLIWSLTKSGDSYIFENSSKYLGYKGSSNESYWLEADENWTTANYLLDITAQGGASDPYYVTLHSNASRYLSKNSSSAFFAFYGNTGQKADIVFVPATVDNRTAVTLSFAESTISKTTANYNEFTGQTATASPNESAITSAITYSMTGDAIGTINSSTGAVALDGTTGTATVTASFAGDASYRPAEASYTITVSSASGPQYELVSTAADVVAGDYIITWDNTYYLPSGAESGTNPAVGTGITVAGDKITNTVTSNMVWTFTGDNTNGFTISDGTNILHSTNAAQGISINTTSTRKWTVSVDATYGMLLRGDDGGTRNLAVYNNASWRYYAMGGSYTGKLRLYKLQDNRADAGMSWSAASASATIDDGDVITFTAPTLTPGNATGITYNSTDTGVATISNTGVVTIVGGGTTTIQAIFAGDTDYKPATAEYTLTVTDNRTLATSTISQVLAGGAGTYTINDLLVYSVVGNQVIVGDATGKMVLYKSGHGLEVGDNISITSATVDTYNGILQIQDGTFNENSNGNAVDHGTATNLNDESVASSTLSTFSADGYHVALFVTMNGTQSARNINGNYASLYLSTANNTYDGQAVIVTGYIYYYNSSHTNYNFQLVSIEVDNTIPYISVAPAALSWTATETDSKTLTVTLNGNAAAGDYTYNVTSGTASDWTISKNNGILTVTPNAVNTSTTDAKSITIRITHADDNTVYQDVVCSQGKAGSTTTTEEITSGTFSGDANSLSMTTTSGITIAQLKGDGTNCNSTYNTVATLRVYRANQMQFTGKTFTKIEMYYTGTYSGASWSVIAGGGTITIDTTNKKVVWTNTAGASTVTLQNSTSSGTNTQLRTSKFYFEY